MRARFVIVLFQESTPDFAGLKQCGYAIPAAGATDDEERILW